MPLPTIQPSDIVTLRSIGQGTFANCKLVALKIRQNETIVLKTLKDKPLFQPEWVQKRMRKEIRALALLCEHSSFVSILHEFRSEEGYISGYTMCFHEHGTVRAFLERLKIEEFAAPLHLKALWMRQVSDGFQYLQEREGGAILHRDLAADNVLIDDFLNAKIADFGLAKMLPNSVMTQETREFETKKGIERVLPETYDDFLREADEFGDRYLYGILVFEVFSEICIRHRVDGQNDDYKRMVKEGRHLDSFEAKIREHCSLKCADAAGLTLVLDIVSLVLRMTAHQVPEQRASFAEVSQRWMRLSADQINTERRQVLLHLGVEGDRPDQNCQRTSLPTLMPDRLDLTLTNEPEAVELRRDTRRTATEASENRYACLFDDDDELISAGEEIRLSANANRSKDRAVVIVDGAIFSPKG